MQNNNSVSKSMEITKTVASELRECCQCDFRADLISNAEFRCFPQSPTAVTFRALITGSPQASAQDLFTTLEEWTSSGPFLTIQAQLLRADGSCAVIISTLGESECNPDEDTPAISTALLAVVPLE